MHLNVANIPYKTEASTQTTACETWVKSENICLYKNRWQSTKECACFCSIDATYTLYCKRLSS